MNKYNIDIRIKLGLPAKLTLKPLRRMSLHYLIIFYYQQPGGAKNPYFKQYSAGMKGLPVIKLCTVIKNNTAIKKILKPVKTNFNIFFIKIILLVAL
jgi:hypothetical protein